MSLHVNLPVDAEELAAVIPILEAAGIRDSYGEDAEPGPRLLRRMKLLYQSMRAEQAEAETAGPEPDFPQPSAAGE